MKYVLLLAALLAGCVDDIDEEWQLDHDRIIAVRATPPRIVSGERAILDVLVGRKGDHPLETAPAGAMVVSPESLADLVTVDSQGWGVTAPQEDRLAAARTELGLIQRAMGFFALDGDDHLADPTALDKLLKVDDLRQLSGRDLRILRNTLYARRGRPFKSPVLRDYFADKDWYHADPGYTDARLTKNDQRNIELIKSVEEELGGPITGDEQQKSLQDPNFDGA